MSAIKGRKKNIKAQHLKTYNRLSRFLIIASVAIPAVVFAFSRDNYIEICSIIITITTGIFTLVTKRKMEIEDILNEEESMRKIFLSGFKDMLRHLEANLKVLVQMRIELEDNGENGTRPASIHFENLKLPADSIIFSEKILLLIDRELVDDITRLQINLRNMNNSAEWLKQAADDSSYQTSDIIRFIDWELYRIMAYYVNAMYMAEHDFRFANEEELNSYFTDKNVQDKLVSLCMSLDGKDKDIFISRYIKNYYEDRRIKRNINFVQHKVNIS